MKKLLISTFAALLVALIPLSAQIQEKEVFRNEDVVFYRIDDHTWIGTGHLMYNESLYLIEGSDKALLIDAGTNIKDLDKIVAGLTGKPVMLVATHVHPDHTGASIDYFPELFINAADTSGIRQFMPNYKGKLSFLSDNQIIDLGGRQIEVVFTPAHTPGSTTFLDKKSGYGFSGDSFGSGNLLLSMNFSTLIATCKKISGMMAQSGITRLYPGHYFGTNAETKQRVDDMITLSNDVLSGKVKGQPNPQGMMGLNYVVSAYGVKINYGESSFK